MSNLMVMLWRWRRRGRLRRVAIMLVCLMLTGFPSPAGSSPPERPVAGRLPLPARRIQAIATQLGAPEEILDHFQDLAAAEDHIVFNLGWPDLDGDHLADVMSVDLNGGALGTGVDSSVKVTPYSGVSGRRLWAKEVKGGFGFPVNARLGPRGENGVLIVMLNREETTFVGLSNGGRKVYRHTFGSGYSSGGVGFLAGADTFDALPGRATEVLIGESEQHYLPLPVPGTPEMVATTQTALIDGRDGTLVRHQAFEIGIDHVPQPVAGPDLDGDDLDDFVVARVIPEPQMDPETGLPAIPELDADYVRARRGHDALALWTSSPVELPSARFFDYPVRLINGFGDANNDDRMDVALTTGGSFILSSDGEKRPPPPPFYVLDGTDGFLLWKGKADNLIMAGRIDGDASRDLIVVRAVNGKHRHGLEVQGLSGFQGRSLYRRFFRVDTTGDEWVDSGSFAWGDLQPDRVMDVTLQPWVCDSGSDLTGSWINCRAAHAWLLSGRTGRPLGPRLRTLWPFAAVDGSGTDLVAFRGPARLSVLEGMSRKPLLEFSLDISGTLPLDESYIWDFDGARLDRDPCADVIVTIANQKDSFVAAIDGASGRLAWFDHQLGLDTGERVVQMSRSDLNRC